MKTLAVLLIALSTLLTGCVVYDNPPRQVEHRGDRDRDRDGVPDRVDRDRDNDGVPNRRDSNPNDPRRY